MATGQQTSIVAQMPLQIGEKVVSVRISLLMQSIENNIASQPQSYTFNGTTTTPTDRRLRQAFTTVVALRNRMP